MNRLMFNTPCRLKHQHCSKPALYVRFQLASCIVGVGIIFLAALIATPLDLSFLSKSLGYSSNVDRKGDQRAEIRTLVKTVSWEYNVPPEMVLAIITVESRFDSQAKSHAGAKGLMQLMPVTAEEMNVVNPYDPDQNIRGGVGYISKLLQRYNGDWRKTLAAYNAGPANVKKHGGIPPFRETQNYVRKVMKVYQDEVSRKNLQFS